MRSWKYTSSMMLRTVLIAGMISGGAPARANGVDGVEFQPIPVNIQNRCSALILKGTNRYQGYAFKMPRVVLSVDKNLEDLFEIIPKGDGSYSLRFGLHFPLTEDAIELRRERSNIMLNTCNDEVVLADLNMAEERQAEIEGRTTKPDPKQTVTAAKTGTVFENKIHTLSPLPISSIQISIDGFQNMTHEIGMADNNLLSYSNMDHIATFTIPDESTYRLLKEQLTGRMGLSVMVKMFFAARAANGRVEVKINTRDLAQGLEAMLGAQIPGLMPSVPGGSAPVTPVNPTDPMTPFPGGSPGGFSVPGLNSPIGDADLRAYFARAVSKSQLSVNSEQSDDENFNRIAYQIVERIAASLPSLPQIPGQSWNPSNCMYNPTDPFCNQGNNVGGVLPPFNPFPGTNMGTDPSLGTGGQLVNPGPPGLGPQGPRLSVPDPSNRKFFNIGAVIQHLKRTQEVNYVWSNLGRKETFSYTTNVLVRGSIPDPGYKTLNAVAGDTAGVEYTESIKAGEKVIVRIPSVRSLVSSFDVRQTYFSRDELRRFAVHQYFGLLQDALSKNQVQDRYNRQTGGYTAVYSMNQDVNRVSRWWQQWYEGRDMTPWDYYWGMEELYQKTMMGDPSDLDMEERMLSRLPLIVQFSEMGSRFKLTDLAKETSKWSGRFEDGQIVLIAKQDLGIMRIRNDDKITNPNRSAEKYFFQVKDPVPGRDNKTEDGKPLSAGRQFDWVKVNGAGESSAEKVGRPNLSPVKVTRSVYVLKVKVGAQGAEEIRPSVGPANGQNSAEGAAPMVIGPFQTLP